MSEAAHREAMNAPIDFVDSHAPIEFNPDDRREAWPMPRAIPPVSAFNQFRGRPTWRERIGLALYRLREKMFGVNHE